VNEPLDLSVDAQSIVRAGARMNRMGWTPATSGNLSQRTAEGCAITVSGRHKGFLTDDDIMLVGLDGVPLSAGKPSAETMLHCHLYSRFDWVGAVLHGHSVSATVLTLATDTDLTFQGFEIQKAFGCRTHETTLTIPVFDNDQDISRLAVLVDERLPPDAPGYILRGHGVYAWGPTMDDAFTRLEALEFLLQCRLEQMKLRS
jgi:methylthioribulose-1-phosphate dehydratase